MSHKVYIPQCAKYSDYPTVFVECVSAKFHSLLTKYMCHSTNDSQRPLAEISRVFRDCNVFYIFIRLAAFQFFLFFALGFLFDEMYGCIDGHHNLITKKRAFVATYSLP